MRRPCKNTCISLNRHLVQGFISFVSTLDGLHLTMDSFCMGIASSRTRRSMDSLQSPVLYRSGLLVDLFSIRYYTPGWSTMSTSGRSDDEFLVHFHSAPNQTLRRVDSDMFNLSFRNGDQLKQCSDLYDWLTRQSMWILYKCDLIAQCPLVFPCRLEL